MQSQTRDAQDNTSSDNTQQQIQDNSSLHRYRTEIPNIIYELKLDVYELALYNILKHVAGDFGSCFQSNNTLAEKMSCGVTKIKEAKNSLEKKGLIKITKRKTSNGGDTTDLVEIVDIWAYNMRKMLEKFGDRGGVATRPGGGRQKTGEGSPRDYKQEPIEQEPIEQQQGNAVAAVFFECLKDIEIPEADKISISNSYTESQVKHAVAFATHPETKFSKGLVQCLKWACKEQPELPKQKEPPLSNKDKVLKRFTHYGRYNGALCFIDDISIAFERGQKHESLNFKEKGFDEQLSNMLRKFGINAI